MSDSRDIPKDSVSDSEHSNFSEHDSSSQRYARQVKSTSSRSTHADGQQVMLGNLIEGCSKGAYSTASRDVSTGNSRPKRITTDTNEINRIAQALEDVLPSQTPGRKNRKWTLKEVKRLHRCVEIFGTDFSLIARMFPDRRRSELMNKFKKEGKKDIQIVQKTLIKHQDMRLSKHLCRTNNLRKESLLSVNSLDSADINLVNQVIKLVNKDSD